MDAIETIKTTLRIDIHSYRARAARARREGRYEAARALERAAQDAALELGDISQYDLARVSSW